jgi:calcineurin-like phosphoesterase family protein
MSRLMITSDLHLGHKGICKHRTNFSTPEEHDAIIFDNLASSVTKRDTLFLLGDIAFTLDWHQRLSDIKCKHKVIILGNHDTDRSVKVFQFAHMYDKVHGLLSHRNHWWSHCPIHPQEMRGRKGNIHGHLHDKLIERPVFECGYHVGYYKDTRYLNACVEHTSWFPISYEDLTEDN